MVMNQTLPCELTGADGRVIKVQQVAFDFSGQGLIGIDHLIPGIYSIKFFSESFKQPMLFVKI